MNLRYLLWIFLCFFSLSTKSQSLVKGQVTDSSTGDPIPFVNIIIVDLAKGTVSNLGGEFNFKLPENAQDQMEVVFSHIGYESLRLVVAELKDSPISITLDPSDYELNQAIVLDFDPKKIIERAQANLKNTQYGKPHEVEVFYRELIWVNDSIQGLARAKGYLHSEGYQQRHSNKPSTSGDVYNFMAFDQIQKSEYGILTTMTGRPRSAVGDLIFPSLIYRLWDFKINWFDYELLGGRKIGDREVYVLAIKAKNGGVKNKANQWGYSHYGLLEEAVFYIDQEDYGVHMMELLQNFPSEKRVNMNVGQTYSQKSREGVVKFRRDQEGKYFFTYANYTSRYTDFGYETEENPTIREVKEFAELYAMQFDMKVLSNEELSEKYYAPIVGTIPDRTISHHPDLYNGWIFIVGKPRYNKEFWGDFDYPAYSGEKQLEIQLAKQKPLDDQFQQFRNNQFYLLPILRRRHGLRENFWNRTALYQHPAEY
ncbi:carboxypeptidase-like regulatory domain-containing protein [Algoriphagus kandeliae]|uniref:Carboxypeptidase-like regulatory domain-containing protein n=1 Tax=Algoriphagus kandeliae TaxID=2562278 RepID=A0A4Y9QPT8_9BACT|nr:carboxypeptidase-like regulatory domain-containing protein [Algoriphagus kandeliae]TFV93602.1 carboxypeptidase-like regulatory domain-containing protein [Algoriphagus kandeliae]